MPKGEFTLTYLERIYDAYRKADKAQKGRMLDEFCRACRVSRKYAVRRLGGPPPGELRRRRPAPRERIYDPAVIFVVKRVWETAGYPWSVRLKEILRLWMPWIQKHLRPSERTCRLLQAISPSTMDRALKDEKRALKRSIYGRTKPGTLLRHQVPISTSRPKDIGPGHSEADLVAHCGPSPSGEFVNSLDFTDIATGWTETWAILGKGEDVVVEAIDGIRTALPFDLLSLDSDNGSEFLNWHLIRYCRKNAVSFTRSRPYKKDDNAHIEQKNWTHVRKIIGWDRYDTEAAKNALNDLYRKELRIWMNLFQPSVRLQKARRRGSRLSRTYDAPRTPLDRLKDAVGADNPKVAALLRLRATSDPFDLAAGIEKKLARICRLARRGAVAKPKAETLAFPEASPEKHAAALARLFPRMATLKIAAGV